MANVLANLARMNTSTVGTGTLTLTTAVNSATLGAFNTFADAGITNGQTVTYAIEDTSGREVGQGVYTSATKTLTRATVYSSTNGGAKLNLSGGAQVFVTGAKEDFDSFLTSANASITYQPLDADLTAIAATATQAFGITLLTATSVSANLGFSGAVLGSALGTAATKATGTSGANVPLLNGANVWSGSSNSFGYSAASGAPLEGANDTDFGSSFSCISAQGSANPGPGFLFRRASPSPAANDKGGQFIWQGNDDALAVQPYASMQLVMTAVTAGTISGQVKIQTMVAGAFGQRVLTGNGTQFGSPTGGDKGAGTVNAQAVYDDSVLLTCPGVEFIKSGSVNTSTWDAFAPPVVTLEETNAFPEHEDVDQVFISHDEADDGSLIERRQTKKVKRQVIDYHVPVYADDGVTGVDMIEAIPRHKVVTTPATSTPRKHELAHEFAAMVADGKFDPRIPKQYFDRMLKDEALPGMPNKENWKHGEKSAGRMITHLWLSMELLAGVVKTQQEQIDALKKAAKI